jgi:hypothetical protein
MFHVVSFAWGKMVSSRITEKIANSQRSKNVRETLCGVTTGGLEAPWVPSMLEENPSSG